ncbi:MAG TPA: polysaccharide deacetylase family protein [Nitrosopumilaceae archaeon]|nr:polysaccharide deacetylase family protein [Nitrosopumilaceae archaeon]
MKLKTICSIVITILISSGFIPTVFGVSPTPKYDGTIGVVTVAFDHGFKDQYQPMLYMKNNNMSGAVWVVTNRSTTIHPNFIPWGQLQSVYDMGFEMASHSRTHIPEGKSLSNSTLYSEIYGSKLDLQNQGFKVCGFVPPANDKNATVISIIKNFYNYSAEKGNPNTLDYIAQSASQNGIPFVNASGVSNINPTSASALQNFTAVKFAIDDATLKKSYLVIHFHDIVNTTNSTGLQYPSTFSLFQNTIDYLKSKSNSGLLRVETTSQALGFGSQCELAYKTSATLSINSISSIPWGNTVTITGRLTNSTGIGVANEAITFNGTGATNLLQAVTNGTGFFVSSGKAPNTVESGWTVQSHFVGDSKYHHSDSTTTSYSTLMHSTLLALSNQPTTVSSGGSYKVTGALKDQITGTMLTSKTISFKAMSPVVINNTVTNTLGIYAVSGLVAPNNHGTYKIQSKFAGDLLYSGSASQVKTLTVS